MIEHADVVVIGAGVSGLAAAWSAQQQASRVVVVEANAECGGVINSVRRNDFLVERGANSMSGTPELMELIAALGLADELVLPSAAAARRYVLRNGVMHPVPSSPGQLLATSLFSTRGKVRALMEPLVSRYRGNPASESVAHLVRRRFGNDVLNYLVDPFVSGVYGGDPEKLSSSYAMRILSELESQHGSVLLGAIRQARARKQQKGSTRTVPHIMSFRNGMQQLPNAIARGLRTPVQCSTFVTGITRSADGWVVDARNPRGTTQYTSSSVIVAVQATRLADMMRDALPAGGNLFAGEIAHARVATVAIACKREQVAHPLDGFGLLVPHAEQRGILGVLFNSSMFEGRVHGDHVLLTCFVGGARYSGDLTNSIAERITCREITSLLGISGKVEVVDAHLWQGGLPQFNMGYERMRQQMDQLEERAPGLFLAGSYRSGVSVGDCVSLGLQVGRRAAKHALQVANLNGEPLATAAN